MDPQPVEYTGIDYLALITAAGQAAARGERLHLANIADGDRIQDNGGTGPGEQEDGQ